MKTSESALKHAFQRLEKNPKNNEMKSTVRRRLKTRGQINIFNNNLDDGDFQAICSSDFHPVLLQTIHHHLQQTIAKELPFFAFS